MPNARWNLIVSQETDLALRQLLAVQGRARKGELSRFVEEAVRSAIGVAEPARRSSQQAEREHVRTADLGLQVRGPATRR